MKKILFVINYIKNSGPSSVVINIINSLDKDQYDISLLTLKDKNNKDITSLLIRKNVNVVQMNYKNNKDVVTDLKNIINEINNLNVDIIHSHGILPDYIVSSSKIKSKKITTIHNNMYEDYLNTYGKIKGKLMIFFHQKSLKKFDRIVCCSMTSFKSLDNKFNNLLCIRNGVNVNKIEKKSDIRNELNIPNDAIVYIYCGNISKGKRVVELIDLFEKNHYGNEYLIVLGDGPLYKDIIKNKTSNIKILGFKDNALDYYAISDIYISNSSSEGFSISVIEALGNGLLLFLSDIPAHKECFEINDKIYIGEFFNGSNFSMKKDKITSNIKKIKKSNILDFQEKYLSCSNMSKQYNCLYNELLNEV